jgi:hypothetical protein
MILSLWVLLLTVCSWPQPSSTNKTEKAAIRRAESLIVSSFDRSLPNVSSVYFSMREPRAQATDSIKFMTTVMK